MKEETLLHLTEKLNNYETKVQQEESNQTIRLARTSYLSAKDMALELDLVDEDEVDTLEAEVKSRLHLKRI
jgi:SPX domain protein involved in polyphosphate accumulation